MRFVFLRATRPALLGVVAVLLAAGGPAPDRRPVPRQQALPAAGSAAPQAPVVVPPAASEPAPVPGPIAAPAPASPPPIDLSGLSPANRARAILDTRRYSLYGFAGSSVADGKLRDIAFAPWTGSWGDDTLIGGAVAYRFGRFWRFFTVDLELGSAYRFGDTEGGEFWAAAFLRYDGFPWSNYVFTTFGLSFGPDFVTRLPQVERGTDARPEPNQSAWLNFFSPELTFALPDYPQYELSMRYMHRSGIFGTYNGVYEGANSFVLGFRYRF